MSGALRSGPFEGDQLIVRMGPFDPALPGPMVLEIKTDGSWVLETKVDLGFSHRGLEKAMELQPWELIIPYVDRLDPESAVFGELVYCLAVEKIGGFRVPERADQIRLILCELSRISSHLKTLALMCRSLGLSAYFHYLLKDREKILDLFELISGSRFALNYLRVGGVAHDISEGFLDRTDEVCGNLSARLPEYRSLMLNNSVFYSALCQVGVIPLALMQRFGVTGANARASGTRFDVRKDLPYLGYDRREFQVPAGFQGRGVVGDSYHRAMVRFQEIGESISLILQAEKSFPKGDYRHLFEERIFNVPAGEAYIRVESPRGLLGCHVMSEGGFSPARIQFQTPSCAIVDLLRDGLTHLEMNDLELVLTSLDPSLAEVDR